jgi:hypothetical protein
MGSSRKQRHVLGIGLDDAGGHQRVTRGPDFYLVGGSKHTHAQMQELTMKSREQLKRQGQTIATASDEHMKDTLQDVARRLGIKAHGRPAQQEE